MIADCTGHLIKQLTAHSFTVNKACSVHTQQNQTATLFELPETVTQLVQTNVLLLTQCSGCTLHARGQRTAMFAPFCFIYLSEVTKLQHTFVVALK